MSSLFLVREIIIYNDVKEDSKNKQKQKLMSIASNSAFSFHEFFSNLKAANALPASNLHTKINYLFIWSSGNFIVNYFIELTVKFHSSFISCPTKWSVSMESVNGV